MVWQYASGRQQICAPQLALTTGNFTSSGTLYFWVQYRNDVGFNLPSESSTITYSAGQGIDITLAGDCARNGENILQYSISANTVDDSSTSKVVLNVDADSITLPHTFTLSEESHITLEETVTTLPLSPDRIDGLVKLFSSTGLVYRYNSTSSIPADGTTVIAATPGNWEQTVDGFTSYVGNTSEDTNGADLNVLDIIDASRVLTKSYSLDGSAGPSRTYWLRNDTNETVSQGTRVGLIIDINGEPASEAFENLIKVIFDGYVDPTDGLLDTVLTDGTTPMVDLGVIKDYQFGRTDLVLQKPLEAGEAFQLRVFPQFNSYELQNVPLSGTTISVLGFFFDEAGSYNDASALIGNSILPENPNLRRVYPSSGLSVFVDEGSGTVGGFFFKDIGSNVVPGLVDDIANQNIVINNNGSVYLNDTTLESNEDLRALVSTVSGESITSSFSTLGTTGDASPLFDITVEYPNEIDPLYDDVIAGAADKGTFNAEEIAIYVSNGTEIRKFSGLAPTNSTSDTFNINWTAGTVVTSVETSSFGLWAPSPPTTIVSSTTGSVTYEAAIGFVYLGNSVTSISHKESDGAIPELTNSISDLSEKVTLLEQNAGFWKEPVSTYASLTAKLISNLTDGQSNRIEPTDDTFEIWTWDSTSLAVTDGSEVLRPDELADDTSPGRWFKTSGGGGGSFDQIVTYNGEVVVDLATGNVVTSATGGTSPTPVEYLESNVVGLSNSILAGNLTLTSQSNKYQILDGGTVDRTILLYDGGTTFGREHLIINSGLTNDLIVEYPSATNITTLTPGQQLAVLWDKNLWRIL